MHSQRGNPILNHIITHTRTSITIPIHSTLVVIILTTAIITTLAITLIVILATPIGDNNWLEYL